MTHNINTTKEINLFEDGLNYSMHADMVDFVQVMLVIIPCIFALIIGSVVMDDLALFFMLIISPYALWLGWSINTPNGLVKKITGEKYNVDFVHKALVFLGHNIRYTTYDGILVDGSIILYVRGYLSASDVEDIIKISAEQNAKYIGIFAGRIMLGYTRNLAKTHNIKIFNRDDVMCTVFNKIKQENFE